MKVRLVSPTLQRARGREPSPISSVCEHHSGNLSSSTVAMLAVTVFFGFLPLSRGSGDGMPTANFCSGSMTTFNKSSSFLPGQDVTITCSLPDTFVIWNSPQFTLGSLVLSDNSALGTYSGERLDGAVVFTLTNVIAGPPPCYAATATIPNIQESMQGLGLSCGDGINFASLTIDVIDPPDPVTSLNLTQICNEVVAKWTPPTNQPCPITGYSVDKTILGGVVSVAKVWTNHTFSFHSSICGKTFEVGVSSISAAGTSNATSSNITVTCTPTDISVVNISDTSALLKGTLDKSVLGVVEYKAMSVQSQAGSVTINVPADSEVIMATVGVDSFTDNVLFAIKSLGAGNDECFTIEADFPAIKYDNVVVPASEMGTVTFPFRHNVMEVTVSPSPVNTSCITTVKEMAVIVNCSDLTNGIGYTVTLRGTLSVEETLLPFTFSESFTPTSGTPAPTQSTTPSEGGHGVAVRLSVSMTFIGASVLSSLITLLLTCM